MAKLHIVEEQNRDIASLKSVFTIFYGFERENFGFLTQTNFNGKFT